MNILQSIGSFVASAAIAVSSFFGFAAPAPEPTLGAALPAATAVFETSLAAPITSSATTLTLTANSVRGGGSVSGYTCLTIDEGSAQAETVCGTLSGTTMTGMSRGISQATGTTTVAALQFSHRRGANVKITDFPVIQIIKAQNNGEDTFANQLLYATGVTPTNTSALTDKEYVDSLAFSGAGVIDATSIAKGVVELATGAEAAASTASGSSGTLVIPASIATSTYNSATAANKVVVTGVGGQIDSSFLPLSTLATTTFSGNISMSGSATSTIASSSIQAFVASTTPTTTWTKPSNLKYVKVYVIGKGGAGGAGNDSGTADTPGAGGSAGGVGIKIIPAAALGATESVVVSGTIGISSAFGSHCTATSGANGQGGGSGGSGFAGGVGTGCDFNIGGGPGSGYGGTVNLYGGTGGSNMFGAGGVGDADAGGNASGYGGGGAGGGPNSAGGGSGSLGAVFVEQFFF